MQQLECLYKEWCGSLPASVRQLAGAGSNRVYYRLADAEGRTVIGCVGTSREENDAFIYLSNHFVARQLSVPKVLASSSDGLRYLQTDLGSTTLFDAVSAGRKAGGQYSADEVALLKRTIAGLPRLQFVGAQGLDYSHCYPQPSFDRRSVFFDLNYFKYSYLKPTGIDFNEMRLEDDFCALADSLLAEPSESFLYRDFQARNVMVGSHSEGGGGIHFIDFQGGRRGPFYYDLASFLWQASARYPDHLRRELTDEYYCAARQYAAMPPRDHFDRRLRLFVLFRTLQVLGAYGFRGYFERKQHFIDSIPPALGNLRQLLNDGVCTDYPNLRDILQRLVQKCGASPSSPAKPSPSSPAKCSASPLVVRVYSFSYKRGVPADESGNGGGYVFDCRYIHNPGRYDEYKKLTGLDRPVISFLENNGEILTFLDSVYRLADAHVERYMERGFTSLMFAFGCTGGQHRSVYAAQHLADHLRQKYPIEVRLCHRELQG